MKKIIYISFTMLLSILINAKIVEYDLNIEEAKFNYTGKEVDGFKVNGQTPMPTLRFTEGDTAVIKITNKMSRGETSLHWHGLIVPNKFDGVPYLTSVPIMPGDTKIYKFPIVQNGTYWYHSHSGLQEQNGMYGSFIIDKKPEERDGYKDKVVLMTDWTDMNPDDVMRRLKTGDHHYMVAKKAGIQKGVAQTYFDAIKNKALGTKIANEWKRMEAMDVSDVFYDKALINGKEEDTFEDITPGEKVKIRLTNGGSSSYFWVRYAGGPMTVIAADGKDVEPVEIDRLIMGNGESYDVLVTVPEAGISSEMSMTLEDRTRSTSLWIGKGKRQLIEPLKPLKYFEGMKMMNGMMKVNGKMKDMGMDMTNQTMDMNEVMYPEVVDAPAEAKPKTLNYNMLKSVESTALPKENPVKQVNFELTGNMDRYVWTINNETLSESDYIKVKKGEVLRIKVTNNTMMRHPVHLHGQFFRAVNENGEYSPWKHTMDIMPMETNILEFQANEGGDWIFHCHILYHMMGGMDKVFSNEDRTGVEESFAGKEEHNRKMVNMMGDMSAYTIQNGFYTDAMEGSFAYEKTRWGLYGDWGLGYGKGEKIGDKLSGSLIFGRYIGQTQWFMPYVGYEYTSTVGKENMFNQVSKDKNNVFVGFKYRLPMLIELDTRVNQRGRVTALVSKDFALTPRLDLELSGSTDKEYEANMNYRLSRDFILSGGYNSEDKWRGGIIYRY